MWVYFFKLVEETGKFVVQRPHCSSALPEDEHERLLQVLALLL